MMMYRYREANNDNINAFLLDKLYFSTPRNFNDPYDCLIYYDNKKLFYEATEGIKEITPETIEKYLPDTEFADLAILMVLNQIYRDGGLEEFGEELRTEFGNIKKDMKNNLKIICFSEERQSELMWAHYADNHKGFLLGYDSDELSNADCFLNNDKVRKRKSKLYQINYSNQRKDIGVYLYNRVTSNHSYSANNGIKPKVIPQKEILLEGITRKSLAWSYEKEHRLIPDCVDIIKKNRISYIKIKPKEVVLGSRISKEIEEQIVEKCVKDGIKVYKAVIDEEQENYIIEYKEI